MFSQHCEFHCNVISTVYPTLLEGVRCMELNTGRSDDDDDDDDDEEDDEHNDVCSSVPLTIADISLYYLWKFGHGHDLWLDIYALNNRI